MLVKPEVSIVALLGLGLFAPSVLGIGRGYFFWWFGDTLDIELRSWHLEVTVKRMCYRTHRYMYTRMR